MVPLNTGDYVDVRVDCLGGTLSLFGLGADANGYTASESFVEISRLCPLA
jgi:hypothetical protein